MASPNMMVRFLRKIGEDDYKPFGEPCTYAEAIKTLSQIPEASLEFLDLESVATGRLVSWDVSKERAQLEESDAPENLEDAV